MSVKKSLTVSPATTISAYKQSQVDLEPNCVDLGDPTAQRVHGGYPSCVRLDGDGNWLETSVYPRVDLFFAMFTCRACDKEFTQQDGEARTRAIPLESTGKKKTSAPVSNNTDDASD